MKKKFLYVIAIALILQMIAVPLYATADAQGPSWETPIHYITLGDSLSLGVTSDNELGIGYAGLLAQSIESLGSLASFNRGFSDLKYKTLDVLKDIEANVERPVIGFEGFEAKSAKIRESIAEAGIITISVGANDVLAQIDFDQENDNVVYNALGVLTALRQVKNNLQAIMGHIEELNPDAEVYVMGYYNSYPTLGGEWQPQLEQLLESLNKAIEDGIKDSQASFVPVADVIAENFAVYVPNEENIHLSNAGYEKVKELFWEKIVYDHVHRSDNIPSEPSVDPIVAFTDISGHWAENDINQLLGMGLVIEFPDGLFLPEQAITRSEFTVLVTNALQLLDSNAQLELEDSDVEARLLHFSDYDQIVSSERKAVALAVHSGIINGYTDGSFGPNKQITRSEMAVMIARTLKLPSEADNATSYVDDGHIPSWAKSAVDATTKLGIFRGQGDNKFAPSSSTKRAEVATILLRMLSLEAVIK